MAQPVFDGHPLEEYFKDSGEVSELMPGGTPDFLLQPYLTGHPSLSNHSETMQRLCFLVSGAVESLSSLFPSNPMPPRTQAFAERFKYGVFSSSLLSSVYATTPMSESHKRALSPPLPGKLSHGHSRTPSAAESIATDNLSLSMPAESETPIWPLTLSFTVAVAALSARCYFIAFLLLAGTTYYAYTHKWDVHAKPDVMTPSLMALQYLVSAGQLWDTVISDTFTLLENEEQSLFCGPTTPFTASSSLRVTLSTSLLTTQTQCDNVRQLLSAITSPSELAQLSEMYAPPSPIKSISGDSHRPLSHPGPSSRATPQTDRIKKRSTWNGSYASLALAGTPPAFQRAQRREKRRSDLNALLGSTSPCPPRTRSRNTPSSPPQLLSDVSEEEGMVTAKSSSVENDEDESFGAAALDLYRNHINGGLRALELSQRNPVSLTRGNSAKRRPTMSPGSKYTSMHTTRHPLSLSSLRQSLQNALASKRFACSHLLALRFEDDEDEVYWEDVRSVMSLLTSTLVDAASRLSEVLDDVEEQHLKVDDMGSESASGIHTPSSPVSPPQARTHLPLSRGIEGMVSFAPTPSHVARFAAHVDAISSALNDARDQLELCITSLKEERMLHSPGHSSHPSTSSSGDVPPASLPGDRMGTIGTSGESPEHPAILAYERLRRELGLALRECERGRERLVHLVMPPTPSTEEELSGEHNLDDPMGLKLEHTEDGGHAPPLESEEDDVNVVVVSPSGEAVQLDPQPELEPEDDAGLEGMAAHLALPGIEQVFEADSGNVGAFTRERSKLSREERIRLVRAKRESADIGIDGRMSRLGHDPPSTYDGSDANALDPFDPIAVASAHSRSQSQPHSLFDPFSLSPWSPPPPASTCERERWGPGGDVVQELKDVIWKVGQRRRKMTESPVSSVNVNVNVNVVPQSACMASPPASLPSS